MFNYLTDKKMFLSKIDIKNYKTKEITNMDVPEIYIDEKLEKIVGSDVKSFFNKILSRLTK